jgi:hypothetical protein
LSSFSDDSVALYGQNHILGDVSEVVKNLNQLARWRDFYKSKT